MMDVVGDELRLIELFRQKAADRRRALVMIANERFDDERRHKHELKLKREEEERKLEEVLATSAQLATFREHLDDYDTAAVRGIMDTRQALDIVVRQREEMERAAYRLTDGRMVFKTEDGQHVFDRRGVELGRDVVHPNDIPGSAPTWEAVRKVDASEEQLTRNLDQWHSYQERVDEAREAVGHGKVTAETLEKMDADLKRSMPVEALPSSLADGPEMSKGLAGGVPAFTRESARSAYSMAGPAVH